MIEQINQIFGNMDLQLLDFLLKKKIQVNSGSQILDVGCGVGRNLIFFIQKNCHITGIDTNEKDISLLNHLNESAKSSYLVSDIRNFHSDKKHDLIICSRVLHFAKNEKDFKEIWTNIYQLLQPDGQVYLAMDSVIDYHQAKELENGHFEFPDGKIRFALTKKIFQQIKKGFIENEPLQTIIYHQKRAQSFVLLQKN